MATLGSDQGVIKNWQLQHIQSLRFQCKIVQRTSAHISIKLLTALSPTIGYQKLPDKLYWSFKYTLYWTVTFCAADLSIPRVYPISLSDPDSSSELVIWNSILICWMHDLKTFFTVRISLCTFPKEAHTLAWWQHIVRTLGTKESIQGPTRGCSGWYQKLPLFLDNAP